MNSEGENCPFGSKCMFIHPSDYLEPVRQQQPSSPNHNRKSNSHHQQNGSSPATSGFSSQLVEEQHELSHSFIQPVEQQQQFQFAS